MADLSKLRKKIKPVIAATGSTVLVTGLLTSCFPSGNLMPSDVGPYSDTWSFSPTDMEEHDAGVQDEGGIPFDFTSGNLMPPDVQELPSKDVKESSDEGKETPPVPLPSEDE
tara:strand:+ start:58 stop:393 length:336 start_codon:yes stop_codon:yes gene_type:complete